MVLIRILIVLIYLGVCLEILKKDINKTMCSLNFAARCRSVELGGAKVHTETADVTKYKKQIAELKEKLAAK